MLSTHIIDIDTTVNRYKCNMEMNTCHPKLLHWGQEVTIFIVGLPYCINMVTFYLSVTILLIYDITIFTKLWYFLYL